MLKRIKALFSRKEINKLIGITIFSVIISLSEVFGLSRLENYNKFNVYF